MFIEDGTIIDERYIVKKSIGQGGMGAVYLVEHAKLGTEWALKQMLDFFGSDPRSLIEKEQAIVQFNTEAKLLALLSHPNIPKVIDFFEVEKSYFLVMEYINGKTLAEIERENSEFLPIERVLNWAVQLCNALDYLHHQKPQPIIFRDLKPDNIMLTEDNLIKLIDFGIAKLFNPSSKTGTVLRGAGTANYSPPEQFAGMGTDERSDIYALGATLYILLTKNLCPSSLERLLNKTPLIPLCKINSKIPLCLEQCILKSMELNKEDRFQSAMEMRGALENYYKTSVLLPLSTPIVSTEAAEEKKEEENISIADINEPEFVISDNSGNIYIIDNSYCIRRFSSDGSLQSDFKVEEGIKAMAHDDKNNIYLLNKYSGYIKVIDFSGKELKRIGSHGYGKTEFLYPSAIVFNKDFQFYVLDTGNNKVKKFDINGLFLEEFGEIGKENSKFNYPEDMDIDEDGNIYIADTGNCCIQKFNSDGQFILAWGMEGTGHGDFRHPSCIGVSDFIYVGDDWNNNIQKFDHHGYYLATFECSPVHPSSLQIDKTGNIYLSDKGKNAVYKFDSNGNILLKIKKSE